MIIIKNGPAKKKKEPPKRKKEKPETKPIPEKKASMRTEKEIKTEVLQSVFAEYQREVYFNKKEQVPILILNYIQTKKDGEECYDPVQVFVTLLKQSMQNITVVSAREPDKQTVTTIWDLIEKTVNAENYRISSYEYADDIKKGKIT